MYVTNLEVKFPTRRTPRSYSWEAPNAQRRPRTAVRSPNAQRRPRTAVRSPNTQRQPRTAVRSPNAQRRPRTAVRSPNASTTTPNRRSFSERSTTTPNRRSFTERSTTTMNRRSFTEHVNATPNRPFAIAQRLPRPNDPSSTPSNSNAKPSDSQRRPRTAVRGPERSATPNSSAERFGENIPELTNTDDPATASSATNELERPSTRKASTAEKFAQPSKAEIPERPQRFESSTTAGKLPQRRESTTTGRKFGNVRTVALPSSKGPPSSKAATVREYQSPASSATVG